MALSLLKQTQNNVSGAVTPNCFVFGYFDLNIIGDITINPPTNAADGQVFCVRINDAAGGHNITWSPDYKNMNTICNGGLGPLGSYMTVFVFADGEPLMLHESYV